MNTNTILFLIYLPSIFQFVLVSADSFGGIVMWSNGKSKIKKNHYTPYVSKNGNVHAGVDKFLGLY